MTLTLNTIGQIVEFIGILIIFVAQIIFEKEAVREYNGVDRYFLHISGLWLSDSVEEIRDYSNEQVRVDLQNSSGR